MRSILQMWRAGLSANLDHMIGTGNVIIDAERAFLRATRARRRSALWGAVRRARPAAHLHVHDAPRASAGRHGGEIREIPLAAIRGTLEPSRARQFDGRFRPRPKARARWERVWIAHQRGTPLPPIAVVRVNGGYAVVDGHHRVSVALAQGAAAIDAIET